MFDLSPDKTVFSDVAQPSEMAQAGAVERLLCRLLPAQADAFRCEPLAAVDGRDTFEIAADGAHIVLRGSSPVAQASALNWYLKHFCRAHISACGDRLSVPRPLPRPAQPCRITTPYRYRYYYNYCTFSYSMVWWDWARWEREIDWMALNGINLPLAITGQEKVWQNVYRALGLTDAEILDFIAGPAYLAWGWMGNLDGWGGPSPQGWIDGQCALQQRIVARERELGIRPVLPAFTGHVPAALRRVRPGARMRQLAKWAGNFTGTWMLDPEDPLFVEIGAAFMREQTRLYGTSHYYSCDSFNENCPPSRDPAYLDRMGKSLLAAMTAVDAKAVWVMQGWMFFFNPEDPDYWQEPQIRALLNSVPHAHMLVLDLHSDLHPLWQKTHAYHGKPWVWNVLHNFGGKSPMYGNLEVIACEPPRLLRDPASGDVAGMGLTPEGIAQNPIAYDLATDMFWRTEAPDLEAWVQDYALRRYGQLPPAASEAWRILLRTVYSRRSPAPRSAVCRPPTLDARGPDYDNPGAIAQAWSLLGSCARELGNADPYRYDLVDLTRQVLSNHADALHAAAVAAFRAADAAALEAIEARFNRLLLDLDEVLGTRREFLLGRWLADAQSWGRSDAERALLEWNARNQLTLWGNRESLLRDYARKEWNGLMRCFYLPRWHAFFFELRACLAGGHPFDDVAFHARMRAREEAWTHGRAPYAAAPQGDAIEVACRLIIAYRDLVPAVDAPAGSRPPASPGAEVDGVWTTFATP
jgi:alpha-N-acetylglucosaminidase